MCREPSLLVRTPWPDHEHEEEGEGFGFNRFESMNEL
jgi:hypothetical protein